MPHIDVRRRHDLGRDAARTLATNLAADLEREYGVSAHWAGDVLRIAGRGVKGDVVATDTELRVQASLSMMMRPLRSTLEREIERTLDDALG
ncbi:MAG: polyhydroxyalkanoic acid system family protein [Bacteroidota bacterium]